MEAETQQSRRPYPPMSPAQPPVPRSLLPRRPATTQSLSPPSCSRSSWQKRWELNYHQLNRDHQSRRHRGMPPPRCCRWISSGAPLSREKFRCPVGFPVSSQKDSAAGAAASVTLAWAAAATKRRADLNLHFCGVAWKTLSLTLICRASSPPGRAACLHPPGEEPNSALGRTGPENIEKHVTRNREGLRMKEIIVRRFEATLTLRLVVNNAGYFQSPVFLVRDNGLFSRENLF